MATETPTTEACSSRATLWSIRFPLAICFFLLIELALLWQISLDEPYIQDWDEGVYLCSARMVMRGNPLFSSVFSSQPPAFLKILTLAFMVLGDSVETGRWVSIVCALIALSSAAWIAWRVVCPIAGPFAILLLSLAPLFFRQARVVEAEMPALAFSLLAIGILVSSQGKTNCIPLFCGGLFFALGGLCKLFVAPMILPVILLLIPAEGTGAGNPKGPVSLLFSAHMFRRLLFFSSGCITMSIAAFFPGPSRDVYNQMIGFHFEAKAAYSSDWTRNVDIMSKVLEEHRLLSFLAISGYLTLTVKRPSAAIWLGAWAFSTALFLIDHSPLFPRHVLLLTAPLAIAAAANAIWIPALLKRSTLHVAILGLIGLPVIILGWPLRTGSPFLVRSGIPSADEQIIRLIRSNTEPSDYVISDQQMQVFRSGRLTPPQLCDTSLVRLKCAYLTDDEAITASEDAKMIILWTGRLTELPRYCAWVDSTYRLIATIDGSATRRIYLRTNSPSTENGAVK